MKGTGEEEYEILQEIYSVCLFWVEPGFSATFGFDFLDKKVYYSFEYK